MKQVITNYTFSTSGMTITLGDFGSSHPLDLKRLYLITDVSTNKILYNFADNTVASATVSSNNVITLSALQGGESSGDSLQIIYDVVVGDPTYEVPQTELTDGTNTANVLNPGTANSNGNALLIGSTSQSATFSVSSASTGTAYDVGNFRYVSVQVNSQYVGTTPTITFQVSNDNSTWFSSSLVTASGNGGSQTTTTTTGIYYGPLTARYFRLNFTGTYSSGTASGAILFSSLPAAQHTGNFSAIQSGTWTVGSNAATGSAVPTSAFYAGIRNSSGNLTGVLDVTGGDSQAGGIAAGGNYSYNGSSWDRSRSVNSAATTTGTGLFGVGALAIYNSTAPTVTSGTYERLQLDSAANLKVVPSASTTGGATPVHYISASGTNATNTKSSAGSVYNIECFNNSTSIAYFKLYDKATAPVPGTDTPVKVILIPANSNGAGAVRAASIPTKFSSGISWAITGGIADSDTTSVAANQLIINFDYI